MPIVTRKEYGLPWEMVRKRCPFRPDNAFCDSDCMHWNQSLAWHNTNLIVAWCGLGQRPDKDTVGGMETAYLKCEAEYLDKESK